MIVMNVIYKCKPEMRSEFLEEIMAEGIDVASRGEEGNIKYDYYLKEDDADELFLLEKWKDAASLDAHSNMVHFKRLGELKAKYVADTIIEKFEI